MSRQYTSKTAVRILCALFVLISAAVAAAGPVESVQAQAPAQQVTGGVTDTWAVQISPGTDPDQLALQMGAQNLGQIGALTGYYLFRIPGTDSELTAMADVFAANSQVVWFEQQVARQQTRRVLEDPVYLDQWHLVDANVEPAWNAGFTGVGVNIAIVDDGMQHTHPDLSAQYKAALSHDYNGDAPLFAEDGDPEDPLGHQDYHGTASAGIAAADYNGNSLPDSCGVGVAYDAGLSGLRLIAAPSTPDQVARALNFGMNPASSGADFNSIYNNSWGPADDMTEPLVGPGTLELAALQTGVTSGRNGKGSIYVWAAGNGLAFKDNVNYDGYANSRYTIAVGAVDHLGAQAPYSEPGAAMLVTAPGGISGPNGIVTTDLLGHFGYSFDTGCTEGNFDGTSASAPIVSGVVALMLDANPNLGWRDVQNILARTAVQNDPTDTETIPNPIDPINGDPVTVSTWVTNGAGLHVNHKYGFGLVNAGAAVAMANPASYINLPLDTTVASGTIPVNLEVPDLNADPYGDGIVSEFAVTKDITLEHVEVVFNASHIACTPERLENCGGFRGDLKLVLTSPSGTQSVLAEWHDDPENDYAGWKFMTVRNWGESSLGTWTLKVTDTSGVGFSTFDSWQLILHGTGTDVFANTAKWTPDFSYDQGWRADLHPRETGDVNGDGMDDLVGFGYGGVFVSLSSGATFAPVSRWTTDFSYNQGWRADLHPRVVGDVNADGADDLVGFGYGGVFVALSNGTTGFQTVTRWSTDFTYNQGWRSELHPRMVGDVNGDGFDDLVGFGYGGVFVALSNGTTGFQTVTRWSTDFTYNQGWRAELHPRAVADLNGDGTDDLIGFGYGGVFVTLSDGSKFLPVSRWSTDYSYNQGWRIELHPRMVGDVNGDGSADVVGFGSGGAWIAISQ